ncbi:SDR family NAD(P)-dependent oxidoreductase [Halovenus sp. WSH3]|uniref:SDR family NAD(P)-dependent oxidoreductase n=1 Tax=Halovenus carboxidivorans TaxID=2692199 RepID=A0A6B0T023_9EURY|nr:SDR family oxidoreductase [Halovenus carboxidivorans]MXR51314.1 SDR family NAD(P)-dependent oxidoreductase [Halovenus carboxidivorans]
MTTLEGETVIVTGASAGLGESMAKRFAREGANVVLTARSEEKLHAVAEEADGETLVAPADVTEESEVRAVVDAAAEEYGEITGLVNNAGIGLLSMYGGGMPLHEVDTEDFRKIVDVNITGVFLFSKHVVPELIDAGRGNIINISSGFGRRAAPNFGPYVGTKWALEGILRTQSMELEDEAINVNGLDPGGRVDTGFWDQLPEEEREGILDPDVMDDAAVALLAQGPDGITGESLSAQDWETKLL